MIPLVHTAKLSREQWLGYRRKGIGGSDMAGIIAQSPWSSPLQVYHEKISDIESEETEQMYFGKVLEPVVASEFSLRTGFPVRELRFMLQHDKHEFLLANVDRVVTHPELGEGILECKTANAFKLSDWEYGKVPYYYWVQVQHYLGVTEYTYAYIAVLVGGNTFRHYFIERNDDAIAYLQEAAINFWHNHVLAKAPPEVSFNDRDSLNALYPEHREDPYHLTDAEYVLMADLLQKRRAYKEAEEAKLLADNRIMALMRECDHVYYGGEKMVSWKKNVKGSRVFKIHCEV